MTTTTIATKSKNFIVRAWQKLAPQVLTFLATGLSTAVALTGLSYIPGVHIPTTIITLVVGVVSTGAATVKTDLALGENAKQITGKLAALLVGSVSVTTIASVTTALHITLPSWEPALAAVVIPLIAGYLKSDTVPPASS